MVYTNGTLLTKKASPMKISPVIFVSLLVTGCGSGSSSISDIDNSSNLIDNSGEDSIDNDAEGNFDSSLFSLDLTEETRVGCTLNDGTVTTCYQITFNANGVGNTEGAGTVGPFCPDRADAPRSQSGFGFYDGATNPGFQLILDAAQNMESDGYNIIDENNNINSDGAAGAACLSMPFADNLALTYLVPVVPQKASEPEDIGEIDSIGFGLHGVPYKGTPPGVVDRDGRIPSLDHCGGHSDPSGYYHWHFIPQSMNLVLGSEEYNFREDDSITCSNSYIVDANSNEPDPSSFAGLAKDGYPIYGALESSETEETEPVDLDQCNGHEHATDEFPDSVYHYHAFRETAPNNPTCLSGKFVTNDWELSR
jgi:hypothetical protein